MSLLKAFLITIKFSALAAVFGALLYGCISMMESAIKATQTWGGILLVLLLITTTTLTIWWAEKEK